MPGVVRPADLCRLLGVSASRLSNWEAGKHDPPNDMLPLISRVTGQNLGFLLGKEQLRQLANAAESNNVVESSSDDYAICDVPYLGEVPCGNWEAPTSDPQTVELMLNKELQRLHARGELAAVRCIGYSNAPRIMPGQYVVIRKSANKNEGAFTLAHNQDGELTLKVLRYNPLEQEWELHSFDQKYGNATAESATILGYAVNIQETDLSGIKA